MSRNMLKYVKCTLIIFIIISFAFSLIVSQNQHHLEVCHNEDCTLCAIIHIAQNIINLSIAFIVCMFVGFLIYFFLSRIYKKQTIFIQKSLVFQKVQMNE